MGQMITVALIGIDVLMAIEDNGLITRAEVVTVSSMGMTMVNTRCRWINPGSMAL